MKIHPRTEGVEYVSVLAVEEFGGAGFTWEIVTRNRRTAGVVATQRGKVRYLTKAEEVEAGAVALAAYKLPEVSVRPRVDDLLMMLRRR